MGHGLFVASPCLFYDFVLSSRAPMGESIKLHIFSRAVWYCFSCSGVLFSVSPNSIVSFAKCSSCTLLSIKENPPYAKENYGSFNASKMSSNLFSVYLPADSNLFNSTITTRFSVVIAQSMT